MKKLFAYLLLAILCASTFITVAAQVQQGTLGGKVIETYDCAGKRIGLVGASNTVDMDTSGKPLAGAWSNANIIKEFCPGATVFLQAKGGTWPGVQVSLVQAVLQNDNLDYVILDPSANGQQTSSSVTPEEYKKAAINLAQLVKDKNKNIKVIMLTNTPTKGAAGGYGTPEAIQRIKTFNSDLLNNKLGRSDLIDYAVDTYSATESSPRSDTCGYCAGANGGLGDGIHFGPAGRRVVMKTVMDTIFGKSTAVPTFNGPIVGSTSSSSNNNPISPASVYSGGENCLSKQRCDEIDSVWLKIVAWINSARKGYVYDAIRGWIPYQEKLPTAVITPGITRPGVVANFCVAAYGTNEQKALLDTIAWAEGTKEKYNVMFGGTQFNSYNSHPVETKEMPSSGITAGKYTSTAAGRYQFLFDTFKSLQQQGYFKSGFGFEEQDRAALNGLVIAKRGLSEGELKSAVDAGNYELVWDKLAPEWASLPSSAKGGKSYYGQPVRSSSDLKNIFQSCLQYHQTGVYAGTVSSGTGSQAGSVSGSATFLASGYKLAGNGWICPEDAPQPNAGLSEALGEGKCPAGMVQVENYCIDKYEASLIKMDGTSWSPYCDPAKHNVKVKAVSLAGAVPQSNINQIQAKQACENAGKRLCTDTEWSRACQGSQGTTYPYGSTYNQVACNRRDSPPHVVARLIGEHPELFPGLLPPAGGPNAWNTQPYMQHPALNQQSNTLTKNGEKTACVSVDGVYDMYGNVYEWTADPDGTFRGDYYQFTPRNSASEGCLNKVTAHGASYSDYSIGFRCCASLS